MAYYSDTFTDHLSNPIIVNWSEELWEYHLSKHQLQSKENASRLIKLALSDPHVVMHCTGHSDTKNEGIYCYYHQISRHQSWITYIKVVVGCNSKPHYVKSVWEQEKLFNLVVKEKKYNYFKEIWTSPNSYL